MHPLGRFLLAFPIALTTLITLGCAGDAPKAHASGSATPARAAETIDRVKSLAGTWQTTGPDGKPTVITYTVTANGSAVREVMFPGSAHEMTNMYHMDGSDLVMTHYCAAGNQPRLRCTKADPKELVFNFDDITNLPTENTQYMGYLTLHLDDQTHLRQEWRSVENGKLTEPFIFDFTKVN